MRQLFDTNILIDYLNGVDAARREIEGGADRLISVITWIEILARARSDDQTWCSSATYDSLFSRFSFFLPPSTFFLLRPPAILKPSGGTSWRNVERRTHRSST